MSWPAALAAAVALGLVGCAGGDETQKSGAADCPAVLLDRAQNVYADDIRVRGVSCAAAQRVATEWGRQNVGAGGANLPTGWRCGAGGDCRKGRARVTWALAYR